MGVERRGRLICGLFARATGDSPGRRRVSRSGPEDKPFAIPKQLVWEAYRRVKANKGAAGVDGQSLGEFESDLRDNLYKIWNRMSSGTYFPPPVKAVEIPKPQAAGRGSSGCPPCGQGGADGGGAGAGSPDGVDLPCGLLRVPAPARSALDAVAKCRQRCWKKDWVIDLDVQKFFDSRAVGPHGQGGRG